MLKRGGAYLAALYCRCLSKPSLVLLAVVLVAAVSAYYARHFTYDASADTLIAENDPELHYYLSVTKHLGGEEFLFLTYTPKEGELLSRPVLKEVQKLGARLRKIDGVARVTTILDAPLIQSPPVGLSEMVSGYRTLKADDVNFDQAQEELTNSPVFKNLLISEDGNTTALRIDLARNEKLIELREERNRLRALENPTPAQQKALAKAHRTYREAYNKNTQALEDVLAKIRNVRNSVADNATAHLGGVPLVASDMMRFIQNDVRNFGLASIFLIMLTLYFFFRRWRWVFLPTATTAVTLLVTIGLLGAMHKPVTVISSNFISLLAILTISFTVHLITRYRELIREDRDAAHSDLVKNTMLSKLEPCFYTALTTVVAFGSLMTSGIVPVTDFGKIMCLGVGVSFFVTYTFFPSVLILLRKGRPSSTLESYPAFTRWMHYLTDNFNRVIIAVAVILAVVAAQGISRLSLESRFLDYFKEDTEIHKGLAFIDKNLGGTIPMDIIIEFPKFEEAETGAEDDFLMGGGMGDETAAEFPERYWYTPDKIEYLRKFHAYLNSRPEVGKVLSLASLEEVAQTFNNGDPLGAVEIVAILSKMPDEIRTSFVEPYAAPYQGWMRISLRVHETGPQYSRDKLIQDINRFGIDGLGLPDDRVKVTGMNVLFNNMLKKLYSSQQSTILFVVAATFLMFLLLLRSFTSAVAGLLPNVLAAACILAFMGFVGMPLDMMTITIAAIIIGIGVDDAIHYLHYFKTHKDKTDNVREAVEVSHRNVGIALYFTSITVVIGFSVLSLSNFIPTIYFGTLTALAMVLALTANLTVLPALLIRFYAMKRKIKS